MQFLQNVNFLTPALYFTALLCTLTIVNSSRIYQQIQEWFQQDVVCSKYNQKKLAISSLLATFTETSDHPQTIK